MVNSLCALLKDGVKLEEIRRYKTRESRKNWKKSKKSYDWKVGKYLSIFTIGD